MRSVLFACWLVGLTGCYASEKLGKDVQDTSHGVRQSGISMKNGALGVYPAPELTSAEVPATPAITPVVAKPAAEAPLPRKEEPSSSLFPQAELQQNGAGNSDLANAPIIPPPVLQPPQPQVAPKAPAAAPAPAAPKSDLSM